MMQIQVQPERKTLEMEGLGEATFLHVFVDGVEITKEAASFNASTSQIILKECGFCFQCGVPTVAARKIGNHSVVWFTNPDHGRPFAIPTEEIRVFKREDYERALGSNANALPELSVADLRHIFSIEWIPEWKEWLYSLPEIPGDETGAKTMTQIIELISSPAIVPVMDEVHEFQTITFGFDLDQLLETRIDVAIVSNEVAFRFRSFPDIPLWFKSNSTDFASLRGFVKASE